MRNGLYRAWGKRLVDLVLVTVALTVAAPLMLFIALLIRLTSRGPALFVQERLGMNGRVFNALKFRTMIDKPRVPDTLYYTGDPSEITAVGRVLRRMKLDELPQILNILAGDMSIVGPRPQLPRQLAEFNDDAKLRLLVRPGLTGPAQINGNTGLTWPERWRYDAEYVRRLSFALDIQIIARTIAVLLRGEERYLKRPTPAKE